MTLNLSLRNDIISAIDFVKKSIATNSTPGLWLVDINLPNGNGFDFIDAAIELIAPSEIPDIFLLTTSIHKSDHAAFEARSYIKGYIKKPLSLEVLKQSLPAFNKK